MINYTEIIISICSLIITGILVPIIRSKTEAAQREKIEYWVEIGVRWAKQYLSSEEGQKKKDRVMDYLCCKLDDLGIKMDLDDLDKIIEAVYERVKNDDLTKQASNV